MKSTIEKTLSDLAIEREEEFGACVLPPSRDETKVAAV